jgi:methylmalonyl-CoA mutase N-terminal domain/subunit
MKIDEFAPRLFWAIGMNHFMEIAKTACWENDLQISEA